MALESPDLACPDRRVEGDQVDDVDPATRTSRGILLPGEGQERLCFVAFPKLHVLAHLGQFPKARCRAVGEPSVPDREINGRRDDVSLAIDRRRRPPPCQLLRLKSGQAFGSETPRREVPKLGKYLFK